MVMSFNDNFKSEFDIFSSMVDIDDKKEHLVSANGSLFLSQSKKPVNDFISYLKIKFYGYEYLTIKFNTVHNFFILTGKQGGDIKTLGQFYKNENHVSIHGFQFKSDYMNDLLDKVSQNKLESFNFDIYESCLGHQHVSGFLSDGLVIHLDDLINNTSDISPSSIDNNILEINGDTVTYIIPFMFGRDYQRKVTVTQSSSTVLNQKIIDSIFEYVSTFEKNIFDLRNKNVGINSRNYNAMVQIMFDEAYSSSVHLTYVNQKIEIAVASTLQISTAWVIDFIQSFYCHYDILQKPLFRIFYKGLKKLMLNCDDMKDQVLETEEDFENYFLIQHMTII